MILIKCFGSCPKTVTQDYSFKQSDISQFFGREGGNSILRNLYIKVNVTFKATALHFQVLWKLEKSQTIISSRELLHSCLWGLEHFIMNNFWRMRSLIFITQLITEQLDSAETQMQHMRFGAVHRMMKVRAIYNLLIASCPHASKEWILKDYENIWIVCTWQQNTANQLCTKAWQ